MQSFKKGKQTEDKQLIKYGWSGSEWEYLNFHSAALKSPYAFRIGASWWKMIDKGQKKENDLQWWKMIWKYLWPPNYQWEHSCGSNF